MNLMPIELMLAAGTAGSYVVSIVACAMSIANNLCGDHRLAEGWSELMLRSGLAGMAGLIIWGTYP